MKKHATPIQEKKHYSTAAAADACDQAVGRLDVVLDLLESFREKTPKYPCWQMAIIEENLLLVRNLCEEGSEEYVKAIEAEEQQEQGGGAQMKKIETRGARDGGA